MPRPEPDSPSSRGLDRRDLLVRAGTTLGAATAAFWFAGLGNPLRRSWLRPTEAGEARRSLTAAEWAALAAAADRLLPSGGPEDPGARDVNAIGYLDALLAGDEVEDETKAVVRGGAAALDRAATARGAASFAALSPEDRDGAIREYVATADGRAWLEKTLPYVLESFLGDPVHGGNVGMAGWRWAQHKPGTPRPKRAT